MTGCLMLLSETSINWLRIIHVLAVVAFMGNVVVTGVCVSVTLTERSRATATAARLHDAGVDRLAGAYSCCATLQ